MNLDLFSAFIIGLLGSAHCIGMCGGITTMLTSSLPQPPLNTKQNIAINVLTPQSNKTTNLALVLYYNLGRIATYAFIGAIVGFTGSIAAKNVGVPIAGLRIIAAIFLILLGLYLGNWLMWLNRIEAIGKILWQKISPLTKKVIPVDTPFKALGLGALWGWLPCGLVYSTLTWALASGSLFSGAAIMICFGLGTLPALVTLSLGFISIKNLLVKPIFRHLMALSLISYGIYSFFVAYQLMF
ncbi:MAG: sulfite exporter TauE/SafE family protein [Colwellia sp.]